MTFAKMEVVKHVDSDTVKNAFEKNIASSQTIISAGFPSYNIAKNIGHDHRPEVVYPMKGKPNYDVLKWVNILVSNAKAFILGTFHGVQKKHLQKYLDDYCYRFNRRWWQNQGLDRLLMACTKSGPVGLSELMA